MNKETFKYKPKGLWVELILVFIGLPIMLVGVKQQAWLIAPLIVVTLIYILLVSQCLWHPHSFFSKVKKTFTTRISWLDLWPRVTLKLVVFAISTSVYVSLFMPDSLFTVVINHPGLWIIICFVYIFLSVLPQEFLYRAFFFKRYGSIIQNKPYFILLNATVFCLAHLMFFNTLVLVLTFAGGLLFAYTYQKTKSYKVVCIEHALYGLWLFTVGMGEMLAFPGN